MKVKGTAIASIPDFVLKKFGKEGFNLWLNALPERARKVYASPILVGTWYPLKETLIEPSRKMCDLFYHGDLKGAKEAGRFSAEIGLKGMYRFFVKLGSPEFLIRKASAVLTSYYQPSEMKVVSQEGKTATARIVKFPEASSLTENRIAGWMERAMEISSCKNVKVQIPQSMARGGPFADFVVTWT